MALKKWIALIATIMMVAGCFAACSSAPAQAAATAEPQATQEAATAEPEATAEPITLVFWHTYGDGEEEQFKNVVLPMWNELHPEIAIEAVRQDGSQYHEMIVTSFGTGQSPDVARIDIVNTAAYASQGGLVALNDYEDFAALKDTFLEGPLSTNLYQGSYYGLPLDTNCKAAVINTAIMKELGIEGAPATMEEFIAAAETRGTYSLNVSGVGDWDLYPYFWLFGGTLTDEGFTKASGYLDSAASVAAIQTLLDLHAKKVLTIRDVDGTTDAWDGINSEYAMFFEGPWFFGSYEEKLSQGIIAATIPTYNGRSDHHDRQLFRLTKHL